MTLPEAMTHSCNRPFTWAAYRLAGRLKDVVHEFELKPPDAPALVPLGGIEASPLQLARAYAAVANDGWLPNARTLVAALGRRGNVLYTSAPYSVRVMTPQTIAAVRDALRRPVESGTARRANSDYATVYGKTGTTSRDKDALFVGLTDDYVGAFWIGTDNSQSMHRIYGSGRPTQAFRFVTDSYYRTRSPPPQIMGAERTPPWWLHTPDFLQDRRRRYYIILGAIGWSISIAAAFAVRFWLRLRGPIRGHVAQVLNVLRIPHEAFVRFAQRLKQIRFSRS
jgi:membrane peptidoglycan carboxypeptidase